MGSKGSTGVDALLEVLIAQLHRNGILDADDIDTMMRRLLEAGDDDMAEALHGIVLSDMIDDPARRRASIHAIGVDGGNEAP